MPNMYTVTMGVATWQWYLGKRLNMVAQKMVLEWHAIQWTGLLGHTSPCVDRILLQRWS